MLAQAVSTEEGEALARELNIPFFETSAQASTNVEKAFVTLATTVKDRLLLLQQRQWGGAEGAGGAIVHQFN